MLSLNVKKYIGLNSFQHNKHNLEEMLQQQRR